MTAEHDAETRRQRGLWSTTARAWTRWADRMEAMAERFNRPLVEAVRVNPGERALDLASGAGEPGITLARALGPEGEAVLTDLALPMLQGARRRADERGLANIRFAVANAEALGFGEASFHAVTCRFGLMFFPRPVVALCESLRVLKPGGRAAYMVWGPRADNPMFEISEAALEEVLGPDPNPRDPFRFAAPGVVGEMFNEAGFAAVDEIEHRFERKAPLGEKFWQAGLEMGGGGRLENASDALLEALDQSVQRRLEPYRAADGYRLGAHIRIIVGRKP
ncbi:MAG: class I SAM-dependent methyltransferase [Proteobacteria bacterium]|nr:class I SAM-dependent methyltransferase [Pseudomonadota bacterium]MBI3498137.1 class I SAM-dependent methyltransferase [Pseudomonadota bacterium]